MKVKFCLSVICGIMFAVPFYFVFLLVLPEEAFVSALMCGLIFTILLFPVLIFEGKRVDKKYAIFEKEIQSAIFYKANGNFNLGKKVRNGNIYFCEEGIVFASLDGKPLAVEEILLPLIEKYEFDDFHMNIYTKDERKFLITTSQAKEILEILKEKHWIEG